MESEGVVQTLSPTGCGRKMKQSRLPFQVLAPATKSSTSVEPVETRKRKPSSDELDFAHAAKAGRISDVKENFTTQTATEKKDSRDDESATGNTDVTSDRTTNRSSDPSPSGSKKRQRKRGNASNNNGKIVIKLPIGKRKPVDNGKSSKKKAIRGKSLQLDVPKELVVLDDSGLSDDDDAVEPLEPETGDLQSGSTEVPQKNTPTSTEEKPIEESHKHSPEDDQLEAQREGDCKTEEQQKELSAVSNVVQEANSSTPSISTDGKGKTSDNSTLSMVLNKSSNSVPTMSPVALETSALLDRSHASSDICSSEEDIYMLCTPNSKIVPNEEENKNRKLTPKQIARRREYEKRQALKQQEKEEKRRKLQEEREEKAREKEEQERLRKREREEKEEQKRKDREEKEEQKRKEREEKEEQKRKEREEKEKKRQAEVEQKNEEKRLKEEERRRKDEQKEEERKRRGEEKEAEEKRKQKVAQAFTSFFVKKGANGSGVKASDDENSVESNQGGVAGVGTTIGHQRFMPFCVKGDMRLAPTVRKVLTPVNRESLEKLVAKRTTVAEMDPTDLYLGLLKRHCHKPLKSERTYTLDEDEENDDIMIIDDNVCHQIEEDLGKMTQKFRTKYFLFEENRRPPYRGTWRKRSIHIKARRPFARDTTFFDYDVDSDDEWEEEEPGESLHGSDDEKDVDPEEDYEVDNEFFVPHGHLSDEEMHAEEEGELDDNSPEAQKVKLKLMQQEFVAEMKKKTEKIKPRLIGCIWENSSSDGNVRGEHRQPECSAIIWKMLNDRAMLYDPEEPISFTRSSVANATGDNEFDTSPSSKHNEKNVAKKTRITDDAVSDLIRLVHGNVNNHKFLAREFQAFWLNRNGSVEFSFQSIRGRIRKIAEWGACPFEGPMLGKLCWTVNKHVLEEHNLTELTLPNNWQYHLEKQKKEEKRLSEKVEDGSEGHKAVANGKEPVDVRSNEESNRPSKVATKRTMPDAGGIAKFTKLLIEDERQQNFTSTDNVSTKEHHDSTEKKPALDNCNGKSVLKSATVAPNCGTSRNDSSTQPKSKKRINLLMSIPRGQPINQSMKNNLISQFLAKTNSKKAPPAEDHRETVTEVNEVIMID